MINKIIDGHRLTVWVLLFTSFNGIYCKSSGLVIPLKALPQEFGKAHSLSSSYSSIITPESKTFSSSEKGLGRCSFTIKVSDVKAVETKIQSYVQQALSNGGQEGRLECRLERQEEKFLKVVINYDSTKFDVSTSVGVAVPKSDYVANLVLTIEPKRPKSAIAALNVSPTCYIVGVNGWDLPKSAIV